MEYKVISEDDVVELQSSVNMYISLGWVPLGGVSIGAPVSHPDYYDENLRGYSPIQRQYLQAMVHE
jgi:hypothetical protein